MNKEVMLLIEAQLKFHSNAESHRAGGLKSSTPGADLPKQRIYVVQFN